MINVVQRSIYQSINQPIKSDSIGLKRSKAR